jgi:hypothetical protein
MRYRVLMFCAAAVACASSALVATPPQLADELNPWRSPTTRPVTLVDNPESIYAPPAPAREIDKTNEGGVNFTLDVNYLTDYVFRGIDRSEVAGINPNETGDGGSEDAPNLQFEGSLKFDLGRLPHPVIGLFANVYNDDPISRFQEVRPYIGFEWNIKPLTISAGNITYIFPERDDFNTSEVYARVELDDTLLLGRADGPVFSPYIFAAYDYDLWDGLYLEAGIKHDFPFDDIGVVLTAVADVGYAFNNEFFTAPGSSDDTGFQHYDVGLIGTYGLNPLLNIPRRYGQWQLRGYLFYTDGIDDDLRADTQVWGGVGIHFAY